MNCSARCTTKSTRRNRRRQRACATDVRACLRALCCAAGAAASTAPALRLRTGDRAATELSLPRKVAFGFFPLWQSRFPGLRASPAGGNGVAWLAWRPDAESMPFATTTIAASARFGSTRAGAGCHRQPPATQWVFHGDDRHADVCRPWDSRTASPVSSSADRLGRHRRGESQRPYAKLKGLGAPCLKRQGARCVCCTG